MTLVLNKFCCCCTTRTGALVIGTLGWILTLMQIFSGVDQHANQNEHSSGSSDSAFGRFRQNIYFRVSYGLVTLLVCVLLIVGVYKKDRRFIFPWLVLKGLEAILLLILTVFFFIGACLQGEGLFFVIFFAYLLITALLWYFWLCVFSHYNELGEPVPNAVVYSTENTAPPQYVEKENNMA